MNRETLLGDLSLMLRSAARTRRLLSPGQQLALAAAVVLMVVTGYGGAQVPLILGWIVDGSGADQDRIWWLVQQMALIYIVCEVLQVVRKMLVERCCTAVEYRATVAAVSSLFTTDILNLRKEGAGALNGQLHRNVQGVVRLLKLALLDLAPSGFGAAFAIAAAIRADLRLGLVMLGVVPAGLAIVVLQIASQRGIRRALLDGKKSIDGAVVERIGGVEAIRAADTTALEIRRISGLADNLRRKEFRHHLIMAMFDACKGLNENIFHVFVITLAAWRWLQGDISSGDFMALSVLYMSITRPLKEIHRILDEAHEGAINADQFFEMTARPADRSFMPAPSLPAAGPGGRLIEARSLTIDYAGSGQAPALVDLDLDIREGELVAMVGGSGSGKSTLAKALVRLVHPAGGALVVDGVPVDGLSRARIRELFCYVGQEPYLFAGTIRENIAYGADGATLGQIRTAAAKARVADDIDALPLGYETILCERGDNLSGGQRQRVALARAFLSPARVLIVDEGTSALDNTNDRAVMEALCAEFRGRTAIVIAHRLTNLKRVDRVLVFRKGRLVENGSYAALEQRSNGIFRALLRAPDFHDDAEGEMSAA